MRVVLISTVLTLAALQSAQAQECGRDMLAAIVAKAGATLTAVNKENTASFQAKLKKLKAIRGWSDDEMLVHAAPLVKNEAVAAFDTKTKHIYAEITGLGEGAGGPDCTMRDRLNALITKLVRNNAEKWKRIQKGADTALANAEAVK